MLIAVTTTGWIIIVLGGLFTAAVLLTLVLYVIDRFKQSRPQQRKR
jgi:hypothetical protein